ncbi:nuclear pore complex protein Nup160 homolog [Copidosoma floridanum]|uniref:nuclear pore complex protein Nup160 homolog n=1 Tax=Copidosoma floridanum TaxID=29053 RepID=UPI000C6F8CA7|nr:nuclear pore complex protein Nup160 homolog [Copidosoma floridanum]
MVTLSSVLKLSFPHPRTVCKEDPVSTVTMNVQSIFSEALIQTQSAPYMFHLIPSAGLTNSLMPHTATSWMSNNEALFALAYSTGTILILRLNVRSGQMHSSEIKQESIVPRFLSGIATAFRGRSADTDVSMSLVMHSWNHNFYLFSLSREGRLRMWSYVKSQCIADIEVIPNNYSSDHPIQNFGLKKFCDSVDDLYLCTYLKLNSKCEFCILKLVDENEVLSLVKISTLFSTEHHLIDFSFTNTRLWAVWKTTEFHRSVVKHATITKKYERLECVWESAILEQISDTDCVSTDPSIDPRQAYINHIFKPGNFSLLDITKALNVYQKQNSFNELVLSSLELKEKVCLAVESEIQAEIMDYELTDEDYLECVNRCWSKFYSCVQQYHENGSRPVGVLLLPEVHGIILLKKTSFSLLRPMETLEQLMLCNSKTHSARFKTVPGFLEDDSQYQDVMTLLSALITIEEHLTDNFRYHFKKELHQLNSPDVVIERFLAESVVEANCRIPGLDFQSEIFQIIDNIQDLANATGILIRLLTYDSLQNRKSNMHKKDDECPRTLSNVDYYFKSQLGVSVISKTVSQINLIRYSLCRNLLILQQIILCRSELFDSQTFSWIRSNAAPKAVVLMQAYHVVMWICECEILSSLPPNFLESSLQRLSILRRSQELNITKQHRPYSLLESFIQYIVKDGSCVMSGFHLKTSSNIYWHIGMLECVNLISKLIWPISEDFHFPEWLLFSCQFPLVQEYIRILGTWCEWNGTSRKFILAMSFLEMGETQKACDIFLRAFSGVISEKYILELLVTDRKISKNDAVDHYFLTVIKMFEQFNASDCITTLAMNALTLAEKYNQNLPTYYSIIFTQHLGLQHYTEAYNYLNTNPDIERRVDCLRQLVVTLFNYKKLLDLLAFPYVDMYQDLERIMQDRGRSTEVTANSYYDFLYGFHINTGNMRKAASTMYEQAVRLGQEPPVLSFLLRQARCYLAAMNALQLVDNDYRWIVRPFFKRNCEDKDFCWTNKKILDSNDFLGPRQVWVRLRCHHDLIV